MLLRFLTERGGLHAPHGRVTVGIPLVEDLAVVVLPILIPALGALEPGRRLVGNGNEKSRTLGTTEPDEVSPVRWTVHGPVRGAQISRGVVEGAARNDVRTRGR